MGRFFQKKTSLEHTRWTFRASRKLQSQFPENGNLEHYFHAALHLVWVVLEGELSICLVADKQPSNTVTNPRQERLAVDTQSVLLCFTQIKQGDEAHRTKCQL